MKHINRYTRLPGSGGGALEGRKASRNFSTAPGKLKISHRDSKIGRNFWKAICAFMFKKNMLKFLTDSVNFCAIFLHVPVTLEVFPKVRGSGPSKKPTNNSLFWVSGGSGGNPPNTKRKCKICTEKYEYSYELLK